MLTLSMLLRVLAPEHKCAEYDILTALFSSVS